MKQFKMPVARFRNSVSFALMLEAVLFRVKRRCSAERCLCPFSLGLTDFVVAPTPLGIRCLSTGFKFSSPDFFLVRVTSRASLVRTFDLDVAFKTIRFAAIVLYRFAFLIPLSLLPTARKGHVSQCLVCSFVLGILVQFVHSAIPLLSACLSEMYLACRIMLRCRLCYVLGCARCRIQAAKK